MGRAGAGADFGNGPLAGTADGVCTGADAGTGGAGIFPADGAAGFRIPGALHSSRGHGGDGKHRRRCRCHRHRRAGCGILDVGQRIFGHGCQICRGVAGGKASGKGWTGGTHVHHSKRPGRAVALGSGDVCAVWIAGGLRSGECNPDQRSDDGAEGGGGRERLRRVLWARTCRHCGGDGFGGSEAADPCGGGGGSCGKRGVYPAVSGGAVVGAGSDPRGADSDYPGRMGSCGSDGRDGGVRCTDSSNRCEPGDIHQRGGNGNGGHRPWVGRGRPSGAAGAYGDHGGVS